MLKVFGMLGCWDAGMLGCWGAGILLMLLGNGEPIKNFQIYF
jgi:hypothetical protein